MIYIFLAFSLRLVTFKCHSTMCLFAAPKKHTMLDLCCFNIDWLVQCRFNIVSMLCSYRKVTVHNLWAFLLEPVQYLSINFTLSLQSTFSKNEMFTKIITDLFRELRVKYTCVFKVSQSEPGEGLYVTDYFRKAISQYLFTQQMVGYIEATNALL